MRIFFLLLILGLLPHSQALAHRVNIFAYVEGAEVVVECSYSKSKRVNHGSIDVLEASSGNSLLQGETDEMGHFRCPVPDAARASGSDLRILLRAGEGHQNEWIVEAAEFMTAGKTVSAPEAKSTSGTAPSGLHAAPIPMSGSLSRADMEELINAALDAKLAPLKRALLEQAEGGPGVREIVGGIGWIFGLIGIAAYFKSKSRV